MHFGTHGNYTCFMDCFSILDFSSGSMTVFYVGPMITKTQGILVQMSILKLCNIIVNVTISKQRTMFTVSERYYLLRIFTFTF